MDPRLLQRLEEARRNPPPVPSPNTPQEGSFAGTLTPQLPLRPELPRSHVCLKRLHRPPPLENLQIARQHGTSTLPCLDRPHSPAQDIYSVISQIEKSSISDGLWTRTENLLNESGVSVREVILVLFDSLCRRHRAPGAAPLLELEHIAMRTCHFFDCQCAQAFDVLTLLVQERGLKMVGFWGDPRQPGNRPWGSGARSDLISSVWVHFAPDGRAEIARLRVVGIGPRHPRWFELGKACKFCKSNS